MAKSKVGAAKVTVKGFRADRLHPTFVRFINQASDVTEIEIDEPHRMSNDRIEVPAPAEPQLSKAVEFGVALKGQNPSLALQRIRPVIVEISSGQRKYRETIFPEIRRQALRYHLLYEEPASHLLLCPRHGLVRPLNGRCPAPPPHV